MPIHPETARLCASADEALTEGAFRTGEFAEAERLFSQARAAGEQVGDLDGQARAVAGLGMTEHHRNIARLVAGAAVPDADVAAIAQAVSAETSGNVDPRMPGSAAIFYGSGAWC